MNVLFVEEISPAQENSLRALLNRDIHLTVSKEIPAQPDYQVLVGGRLKPEMLTASPSLRTVIIPWAGVPVPVREMLIGHPQLTVHNLHYNAQPTAELALTLLLAAAKNILPLDSKLREGDWRPRYAASESILLSGRTAVILGLGEIGRRVAEGCRAIGMKTVGIRRRSSAPIESVNQVIPLDQLAEVLPRANALIVALPLTGETKGLIGRTELSLLPDRAIVVNVARGPIIQEEALFNELTSGRLRAGLDVWYMYPDTLESRERTEPSAFPFHSLSNVVMTPHVGGDSDQSDVLWEEGLAALLNLAAKGDPLPNRVNLEYGY
ncbi:MAG: hydroxyacid dehydrogenase [candidate division Zixibacteria bacterium]|nr:hydroxyacid dehydrogenase [candidate division Zixibacteria bacterium]